MADTKTSALTAQTTVDADDLLYAVDVSDTTMAPSGTSKKATRELLQTYNAGTLTTDKKVLDLSATWNAAGVTFTGIKLNVTNTASNAASLLMDLQVGGTSKFNVNPDGWIRNANSVLAARTSGSLGWRFRSSTSEFGGVGEYGFVVTTIGVGYGWSSNTEANNPSIDLTLARDAADTLAQRRSTNAQTFRVYNTFTDASNYERGKIQWDSNVLKIGTENAGSGTARALEFQTGGAKRVEILTTGDMRVINGLFVQGLTTSNIVSIAPFFTVAVASNCTFSFGSGTSVTGQNSDLFIARDAANTLAQRNGTNAQESRVYASYTSATNFQRTSIKTVRGVSAALSGATYVTTISIPAYANLIGVTTRVTTEITGATTYDVGDGTDADLWGAAIGITVGSASRTADFTAVGAVGAAATSRTITLTANGSNFTGGVVEICAHYIFTEAD